MSPEPLAALLVLLAVLVVVLLVISEVLVWRHGRQAAGRVPGPIAGASSTPAWYLAYLIDEGPPAWLGRVAVRPLPFRVGRDPGLSLVLSSFTVSREHAELFEANGALHIRDLRSTNGTYVNGRRVSETPLRAGDIVHSADAEFRLEGPQVDRDSAAPRGKLGAGRGASLVPVVWRGEVVGELHDAVEDGRIMNSRYEERRVRGHFTSKAGPVPEEFWRLVQLTDASPRVNEAPGTESFFCYDWCGRDGWLVTVMRRAGRDGGSMAELSLLVEQARMRLGEERSREEAEYAKEYVKVALESAPPWAWPMVMLAPPTDAWRRLWAHKAQHADTRVSLLVGGVAHACRLLSVNMTYACVLTRAPVAGGELGMLRASVPGESMEISAKVVVQGIGEGFLSGLNKRFIRKSFSDLAGPRSAPILAVLRFLDSDPDPEWLPPSPVVEAADMGPTREPGVGARARRPHFHGLRDA